MKATGMVRNVDELGRIVLPKEMRRTLKLDVGAPIEFFLDKDDIVIKKYGRGMDITDVASGYAEAIYMETGNVVILFDTTDVLSAGGVSVKKYKKQRLSPELEDTIIAEETKIVTEANQLMRITSGEDRVDCQAQIFVPIMCRDEAIGGIMMLIENSRESEFDTYKILLTMAAKFIGSRMEKS